MPPSFLGMVQGVTHSSSFEEAVRQGILAAGDNCSRNNFIGAYAAARYTNQEMSIFFVYIQFLISRPTLNLIGPGNDAMVNKPTLKCIGA